MDEEEDRARADPVRLHVRWLGRVPYRDAWQLQQRLAQQRADDSIGDQLLLLEHPPVLTLGRQADEAHVRASPAELAARGIEVIRVERGGEVTYHGPGQLVAYPIVALGRRGLLLRPFVRALEGAMVETCAALGVPAGRRRGTPAAGWTPRARARARSAPSGIRVERGVSYHGIALNVTADLADFALIDPCGHARRRVDIDRARAGARTSRRARPRSTSAAGRRSAVAAASSWLASTGRPECGGRPVRAAQGRDHRLVGRDGRRSHVPSRPLPAGGRAGRGRRRLPELREPAGEGVRLRTLKDFAFHVVGTEEEARAGPRAGPGRARSGARAGQLADRRRATAASIGHSRPSSARDRRRSGAVRASRSPRPPASTAEYVQVVQNWGAQAGARTNHLCLDLYDLPQVPHRVAEEIGGAARFVIREGECPFCRLVRDELGRATRLVWEDDASVAFAPFASRSPFEVWVVPRHHAADFATRHRRDVAATAEALRQVLGRLAEPRRPALQPRAAHRAAARAGRATYHWHWEIHPRLREIAGLELGTGLPVNPVSPEEAVEELLRDGARRPVEAVEWRRGTAPAPPDDRRPTHPDHGPGQRRHIAPGRIVPNHASQGCAAQRSRACDDRAVTGSTWLPPTSRSAGTRSDRPGSGRRHAFVEELFARHHSEIYAYLNRMLRDPELAADLTQDAFVKAYRNYESLEDPAHARAWLYQIAHRVALDEIRRRKIVRFLPWTGESHGSAPSAEHLVMEPDCRPNSSARSTGSPSGNARPFCSPSSTISPGSSWPRRSASATSPPARS